MIGCLLLEKTARARGIQAHSGAVSAFNLIAFRACSAGGRTLPAPFIEWTSRYVRDFGGVARARDPCDGHSPNVRNPPRYVRAGHGRAIRPADINRRTERECRASDGGIFPGCVCLWTGDGHLGVACRSPWGVDIRNGFFGFRDIDRGRQFSGASSRPAADQSTLSPGPRWRRGHRIPLGQPTRFAPRPGGETNPQGDQSTWLTTPIPDRQWTYRVTNSGEIRVEIVASTARMRESTRSRYSSIGFDRSVAGVGNEEQDSI